jgi:hypothetical protein
MRFARSAGVARYDRLSRCKMECSRSSVQRTARRHLPMIIQHRFARADTNALQNLVTLGCHGIAGRASGSPHVLDPACSVATPHRTGHTGGVRRIDTGMSLDKVGMKTVTTRQRRGHLHWPPRRSAPSTGANQPVRRHNCTDDYSLVKGSTPGSSHFSHISSTFAWKYSTSSSKKWAKRPCRFKYSRTGFRLVRPSTRYFV